MQRALGSLAGLVILALLPTAARSQTSALHFGHGPECGLAIADWSADLAALKDRGFQGTVRKTASPPDIGDQETFRVYVYASNSWAERTFQLQDKSDLYHAWVEVNDLAQITPTELATIKTNMLTQTPPGSIDPARGVIANNHDHLGVPPDVDQDGIVDFLFYDIDNQSVGGFVHPGDLNAGLGGNGKDVLHLDVFQSASFLPRLIAHEYTHLIHFNYHFDTETFISEGLAEYAMVMNGFTQDNFEYLSFPTEHKRALLSWRGIDSQNSGRDYDRGRLFFSYIADRTGPDGPGQMIRMERKGASGLDTVLVRFDLDLGDIITDFHTANWVSDRSVNPLLGYSFPFFIPDNFPPDVSHDTTTESDTGEGSDSERLTIEGGAVHYVRFGELADLSLNFDAFAPAALISTIPGILDDIRTRLRGRIVATRDDGGIVVQDVEPSPEGFSLPGNYEEVVLVTTSDDPVKTARYAVDAAWNAFGSASSAATGELPGSFSLNPVYPNPIRDRATVTWSAPKAGFSEVLLVDALGRARLLEAVWRPLGDHRTEVELGGIAPGAYLIVVQVNGNRKTQAVTVIR